MVDESIHLYYFQTYLYIGWYLPTHADGFACLGSEIEFLFTFN